MKSYLVSETDAETEQKSANNKHPNGLGEAIEQGTGKKQDTAEKHRQFSSELSRHP